jgi:hypothetical protein
MLIIHSCGERAAQIVDGGDVRGHKILLNIPVTIVTM